MGLAAVRQVQGIFGMGSSMTQYQAVIQFWDLPFYEAQKEAADARLREVLMRKHGCTNITIDDPFWDNDQLSLFVVARGEKDE